MNVIITVMFSANAGTSGAAAALIIDCVNSRVMECNGLSYEGSHEKVAPLSKQLLYDALMTHFSNFVDFRSICGTRTAGSEPAVKSRCGIVKN